jgi:squalene cyclase
MPVPTGQIDDLMQEALAVLESRRAKWDFTAGRHSLDTTNHVLRVLAQENAADQAREACRRKLSCQRQDGGWGEFSSDAKSGIREAAFCTRNLVTLNRRLQDPSIAAGVERAVRYLLAQQEPAGGWLDALWGRSDGTSIALGALMAAAMDADGSRDGVDVDHTCDSTRALILRRWDDF